MTTKIAFRMFLNPGQREEYKRRHDAIWPELVDLLKTSGISDYSIFLDEERDVLFSVMRLADDHTMDTLPQHPVMGRWWVYMADIMRSHPDGSPVMEALPLMFHLD
ncbi:L-rhamnose mutarotase [Pelomonas sp. KK5]|uniref:L-rhamnose mutarotase n=1 Tax=Pelomonas sp. KK5 TaxID=1855730 RepID=UPI00097C6F6A|nr:L-rhamnose mutarotase [Pelomonas sp. KK5]